MLTSLFLFSQRILEPATSLLISQVNSLREKVRLTHENFYPRAIVSNLRPHLWKDNERAANVWFMSLSFQVFPMMLRLPELARSFHGFLDFVSFFLISFSWFLLKDKKVKKDKYEIHQENP